MRQNWADYRIFWREFRHAYHTTGALLPSGPALAAALCRYVRAQGEINDVNTENGSTVSALSSPAGRRILEVGPGTGAVTGHIVGAMRPADHLVLVERNEQFVSWLRTRFANEPRFSQAADRITLIGASVVDLPEDEPFDAIISGLPLNNFPAELVEQILSKLQRLLAPDGTLSFFEYVAIRRAKSLISSPVERERLRAVGRALGNMLGGSEIDRDLVLANVPPAWVHHVRFTAQPAGPAPA